MTELCSEGYFQTLGLQLVEGRLLSAREISAARRAVVVNQTFARMNFGRASPLGKTVKFDILDELPDTPRDAYFEIIGVVTDSKNAGLLEPALPEAFLPYTISTFGERVILAKTSVDPKSLLTSVQQEVWAVDPNAAVAKGGSVKDLVAEAVYTQPRFGLFTISAFAGIGLALVLIGIFSVLAYTVALLSHEIGVRMALGAQRRNVLAMVLWKGLRLISAGTLIGVAASLGMTRLLVSQLRGVSSTDPWTYGVVVILFVAIGSVASLLPARRAAGIDPLAALRYE